MIEAYAFGSMEIDGKRYTSDVMVGPHEILAPWWRRDGHSLCLEDLDGISGWKLDILVIGTGASGGMAVPEEILSQLESRGMAVEVDRTATAVARFNEHVARGKKVGGAFHLTC